MSDLIIEYNETYNYNKVYCKEGHYITSFNDGDDILTFIATKLMYCPVSVDVEATYHCITDEQYENYSERQKEAEEKKAEEDDVEVLYNEYKDDPKGFYNALVEKFGEDTEKIDYYFNKYFGE